MHTCDKQAKINFIRYNFIFEKKASLKNIYSTNLTVKISKQINLPLVMLLQTFL